MAINVLDEYLIEVDFPTEDLLEQHIPFLETYFFDKLKEKDKKGDNHINEKIIEEANEYIEAVGKKNKEDIIHEAADLWFHNLVSLSLNDISSNDILEELRNRFGLSGLEEKKLRKK